MDIPTASVFIIIDHEATKGSGFYAFAAIVLDESLTQILVITCITIIIGTFLAQRGAA